VAHGQTGSTYRPQEPAAQRLTAGTSDTSTAAKLFMQFCAKCHGADGTGSAVRNELPKIPNFTDAAWHMRYKDAQLAVSILDGKGASMPSFTGKVDQRQVRALVGHIRAFAPAAKKPPPDQKQTDPSMQPAPNRVEDQIRVLKQELDELREQFRRLSEATRNRGTGKAAEVKPAVGEPSAVPAAADLVAARKLFAQHCKKCHGADGTGSAARDRLERIPNFTDATWQARRTDAQLVASVLDGKGGKMPAWREKIGKEQARGLVVYVRTFAAATKALPVQNPPGDEQEEQAEGAQAGPAEPTTAQGFFASLIRWLGNFHAAVVHFPIGLLTAAATAELLRLVTARPDFDAVVRYCIWFGALAAVAAGTLGWFLAGFRLTDASWELTTHRWLGTTTVTCAVLVLVLEEVSRRCDRRWALLWARGTLLAVATLVLATGFFGGAVAFGFDHYDWPQ
jgi:mono/diheme cytochrome c family protein/uncharacterized membrane protein